MKKMFLFAAVLNFVSVFGGSSPFHAKWIGPAPETRPDFDMGLAQWITSAPDEYGRVSLLCSFECPALGEDAVVEIVHAGTPNHEIAVNGRQFHRAWGHVHDWRQACFRNIRPWLKEGRNQVSVTVSGEGDRAFIAKIVFPDGKVIATDAGWKSANGEVKALGQVRDTPYGCELKLRTETASPAFSKRFSLRAVPVGAELRITAAGHYEALLNGKKIGDKVLDPSPTAFDKRVLYSAYDLKGLLHEGENELLVLVGHGWHDIRSTAVWNFETAPWRDFPRVIAQLDVTYADGSVETVGTDSTWRQVSNPVVFDDVYEGEVVDGRIKPGAPLGEKELFAVEVPGPKGRLEPQEQPAAKVMEEFRASAVHPLGDGECMIEFPANVVGWIRLPLYGQKSGDVVSFRYDERMREGFKPAFDSMKDGIHDWDKARPGDFRMIDRHFRYPASYRVCAKDAAFQCDRYICRGEDGESFEPRFTYKGFRYVYVRGLVRMPKPEDVVACFVHTGFRTIGEFDCSDATFNRLMEMGVRAYKSNFTDGVPTDCPHREKNGWTGDASIASELAQYVFDNTAAYEKWLGDIIDAQLPDGNIPGIVPTSGWGFKWGNGPAWDSALSVIPWNLWVYRGDRAIVDKVYPALVKCLAYTSTRADEDGLVKHGLGDWNAVVNAHMPSVEFSSSCYYYQAQRIAAEMAKLKGLVDEAKAFDDSAAKTRCAIRAKFARPDGVWDNGGQTAQAMALAFGIVDESERAATERMLVKSVERTDCHVDMGLLGTKHVFRALSRAGRTDLAWRMLTNETSPSPVDWIKKGGTTLWEDWGDGSSRNHIMYGDFVGWAYQYLAGIRLAEAEGSTSAVTIPVETAFRKVVVEPVFLPQLERLSASTEVAGGRLGVSWKRKGSRVSLAVTIPDGVEAEIRLPGGVRPETKSAGMWEFEFSVPTPTVGDDCVKVDFSDVTGPVKPVNGVGEAPMIGELGRWNMMHYLKAAGIPYSRLHDVRAWIGGGMYVDIPNLFRNFDADENDERNYTFAYTDNFLKQLVNNGVEPFFRLGITIENFAPRGFPPYNSEPPKDYAKWARICEHVIRHYTEGWANGFKWKISYWEIWNEPENNPEPIRNPMWRGDWKSFCDFYGTVAPYLKQKFPHLKIGGYGNSGFYAGVGSEFVAAANSSPSTRHFVECAHKFLGLARDNKWPLDFFSFHSYSRPGEAIRQVRFADGLLDKYGFTRDKCERVFNEWLPAPSLEALGTGRQAVAIASELVKLQNGPCDIACIYDARCDVGSYSPLFNPLTQKPHKAYYSFVAFNELRKLGRAVKCEAAGGLDVCAATDGNGRGAVMIVNDTLNDVDLPRTFGGHSVVRVHVIDDERMYDEIPLPRAARAGSVLLIETESDGIAKKTNYTDLVDPFWGNGPSTPPASEGIARAWNWLKPQCGNTHPGAVLPLGWVSACAYSGGYSSGYGRNDRNSAPGVPKTIYDENVAFGFTHFHNDGTGGAGRYYNHFLFTPYAPGSNLEKPSRLVDEKARPGFYAAGLPDYGSSFELTVGDGAAVHRHKFAEKGGKVRMDATHVGLRAKVRPDKCESVSLHDLPRVQGMWCGTARFHGVDIHYAIAFDHKSAKAEKIDDGVLELHLRGNELETAIGFSLVCEVEARMHAADALQRGFDAVRMDADRCWERILGRIRAEFDDEADKRRFYTALYRSLVKPGFNGKSFGGVFTFWDVYRTQLPLMQAIAPDVGEAFCRDMVADFEKYGLFPNLKSMEFTPGEEPKFENQGLLFQTHVLVDGFFRGQLKRSDYPRLKPIFERLFADVDLRGRSPAHALDVCTASAAVARMAEACEDFDFARELRARSEIWRNVLDEKTGLFPEGENYYEGDNWTYSFRPLPDMKARIEFAGGKARFTELLDKFFGFDADLSGWTPETDRIARPHRFEGLNNQSDYDTPFAYHWVGRHDRLAEVIDHVRRFRFSDGPGGLPGNCDSGGLSSWYVWSCLGIHPDSGASRYLLGTPLVKSAEIDFARGTFRIETRRNGKNAVIPKACFYNNNGYPRLKTFMLDFDQVEDSSGWLLFDLVEAKEGGLR